MWSRGRSAARSARPPRTSGYADTTSGWPLDVRALVVPGILNHMGFIARRALKTSLWYLAVATAWIVGTSLGLGALDLDSQTQAWLELIKGGFFVSASAAFLFITSKAGLRKLLHERSVRERAQIELAHALHQSATAVLAASVAHDLNNVLVALFGELDDMTGDEAQVERMTNALRRAAELSRGLMRAGGPEGTGQAQVFEVGGVIEEALVAVRRHRSLRECAVTTDLTNGLEIEGFPQLVYRVVVNLAINSADADAKQLLVRLLGHSGGVTLEMHDDGPGFPTESKQRLLEAFFTTKKHGTGLGLLSARLCADLHSGSIEFGTSDELGGALVRLVLGPVSPSQLPPPLERD